jgi:hypothetical protein
MEIDLYPKVADQYKVAWGAPQGQPITDLLQVTTTFTIKQCKHHQELNVGFYSLEARTSRHTEV